MQYIIPASRTGGRAITVYHSKWYVPSSRGDVSWMTVELRNTRERVWSFKDGGADSWAINQVKDLLPSMKGRAATQLLPEEQYLFLPIPASTIGKTHERLSSFTRRLCREVEEFENGFGAIERVEDVESKTISGDRRRQGTQGLQYDSKRIRGRRIVLFDDVVTKGHTIIDQVKKLRGLGALQILVMTLARTVPYDHSVDSYGNLLAGSVIIVPRTPSMKIIKFDGGVYEGEVLNNKWHGYGTMRWESGNVYEGDFADGKRTGKGVFRWADGDVYEGDYVDGRWTGKGVFRWASGNVYEGDFVEGKRTGKGVYQVTSGDVYEGDYVEGKLTGKGVFRWSSGNVYEGDFVEGKLTGKGVFRWASGNVYEGDFVEGKRTGKGVFRWTNGDVYEGDFVDGRLTGFGIATHHSGMFVRGGFKDGQPFGPIVKEWPDGSCIQCFREAKACEGPARYISGCCNYEIHILFLRGLAQTAILVRSPDLKQGETKAIPLGDELETAEYQIISELIEAGFRMDVIKGVVKLQD